MATELALHLDDDGAALRRGADATLLARARLSDPDFEERIAALHAQVVEIAGPDAPVEIVLPDSQVLYSEAAASGLDAVADEGRVRAALEGSTPYPLDELIYDWAEQAGRLRIAVVARETIEEAAGFATQNGFRPVAYRAAAEGVGWAGRPLFDPTRAPGGTGRAESGGDARPAPVGAGSEDAEPRTPPNPDAAPDRSAPSAEAGRASTPVAPPEGGEVEAPAPPAAATPDGKGGGRGDGMTGANAPPPPGPDDPAAPPFASVRVAEDAAPAATQPTAPPSPKPSPKPTPKPTARPVDATRAAEAAGATLAPTTAPVLPPKPGKPAKGRATGKAGGTPSAKAPKGAEGRSGPAPGAGARGKPKAPPSGLAAERGAGGRAGSAKVGTAKAGSAKATSAKAGGWRGLRTMLGAGGGALPPDAAAADAPTPAVPGPPAKAADTTPPPAPAAEPTRTDAGGSPRAATTGVLPAPKGAAPSIAGDMDEADSLTVFGARRTAQQATRRGPRYLGLTLTLGLLGLMGAVALWSLWFGAEPSAPDDVAAVATAPEEATSPPTPADAPAQRDAEDAPAPAVVAESDDISDSDAAPPSEVGGDAETSDENAEASVPLDADAAGPGPEASAALPDRASDAAAMADAGSASPPDLAQTGDAEAAAEPVAEATPEAPDAGTVAAGGDGTGADGDAEPVASAPPVETSPAELDSAARQADYALSGTWQSRSGPESTPDALDPPRTPGTQARLSATSVARLPAPARRDARPATPSDPLPAGTVIGPDGFVVPTEDGAWAPGNYSVHSGTPPIIPPRRPELSDPDAPLPAALEAPDASDPGTAPEAQDADETAAPVDPLSDLRPIPRPQDIAPEAPVEDAVEGDPGTEAGAADDAALDVPREETAPGAPEPAPDATASQAAQGDEGAQIAGPEPDGPATDDPATDGPATGNPDTAEAPAAGPDAVAPPLRPRARPSDVSDQAAALRAAATQAEAVARAAAAEAAAALQEAEAALEADLATATPSAVARSLLPRDRPSNIAQIAARAQAARTDAERQASARASQTPEPAAPPGAQPQAQPPASAGTSAQAAPAATRARGPLVARSQRISPAIPSSAAVAREATQRNALRIRDVTLIGIYGSASQRRALVRLPSGRYVKLQVGDRIDGGRVSSIERDELRYVKGGGTEILRMPSS